jgi:hypothetical protein
MHVTRRLAMVQLGLPFVKGSVTSEDAADSMESEAATLRAQVYKFIKALGEKGATDEEVQLATNMVGNTQRPRRRELQLKGRVVDSGRTRKTQSGRNAVVWVSHRFAK